MFSTPARRLALVFAIWTTIALVSGTSELLLRALVGEELHAARLFRHLLVEQWIWAALTPVAFWFAGRVPLARQGLPRAMAAHAAMFLALSLAHGALAQVLDNPLRLPDTYRGSPVLLRFLGELYSDFWMYWPLVGLRALMDANARERTQERQAARLQQLTADLRLSLLRAQIQPHFLFNTLHAISALLRTDPRAAEDLVADLADILRASFADASGQETSFDRERELVCCYLRIQQHRFGDRLRIEWLVDEAVHHAALPALVLQSLVENAVVHGLAPAPRGGVLRVRASREGDRLLLIVQDDGVGLAAGAREGGIGLANTRERLRQMYGDAQSFDITSAPGQGTLVRLALPWRVVDDDAHRTDRNAALAPPSSDLPDDEDHPHPDRGRRAAGPAEPVVPA